MNDDVFLTQDHWLDRGDEPIAPSEDDEEDVRASRQRTLWKAAERRALDGDGLGALALFETARNGQEKK